MTAIILLTTTVATAAEAEDLAQVLVAERLAACVQIDAVRSCYRWEGQVTLAPEARLTFKTAPDLAAPLQARLATLHPYDVPEIVLTTAAASPGYAAWIAAETRAA